MKLRLVSSALTTLLFLPLATQAADAATSTGWHAQTLGQALGYMILFSAVGISAAIAGYTRSVALLVGKNRVRAYRLQTKIFDRYRITFFISPVGELLRAEFPGSIVLVNDALAGFRDVTP